MTFRGRKIGESDLSLRFYVSLSMQEYSTCFCKCRYFRHNTIVVHQTSQKNLNGQDNLYLLLHCSAWRLLSEAPSHFLQKFFLIKTIKHQKLFYVLKVTPPGEFPTSKPQTKKMSSSSPDCSKNDTQQKYFNRSCTKERGGDLLIHTLMRCWQRLCSHAFMSS